MAVKYQGRVEPAWWVVDEVGEPPLANTLVEVEISNGGLFGPYAICRYIDRYLDAVAVDGQVSIHAEGEWVPARSTAALKFGISQVLDLTPEVDEVS